MQILGMNDRGGIQHVKMIEEMRNEFHWRMQMVIESDRMDAIDILATRPIIYSFKMIDWNWKRLRRTRKKKKNTPPRKRPSLEIRRG